MQNEAVLMMFDWFMILERHNVVSVYPLWTWPSEHWAYLHFKQNRYGISNYAFSANNKQWYNKWWWALAGSNRFMVCPRILSSEQYWASLHKNRVMILLGKVYAMVKSCRLVPLSQKWSDGLHMHSATLTSYLWKGNNMKACTNILWEFLIFRSGVGCGVKLRSENF